MLYRTLVRSGLVIALATALPAFAQSDIKREVVNVATIKVPLFVAQGRNDPRVPMSEAEQIVKAVRGNGQPVWYVLFADEGHGFRKKANNDYFNAATMLFWQQYLLGGE